MVNNVTAGIIGCDTRKEFFEVAARNTREKFYWKKIFTADRVYNLNMFPGSEIVADEETILRDTDISLVFVSPDHLHIVPKVIEAGKSVRVI
jgi:hypothetical protein